MVTVRVKSSHPDHVQGFYVINESDFDKEKHELWVDEAEAKRAEIKHAESLKAAQAIKAAQNESFRPAASGAKPAQAGMSSSGSGSDRK